MTRKEREQIFNVLELGITTDGAHHKQWALIEIAKICGFQVSEELENEGIAP